MTSTDYLKRSRVTFFFRLLLVIPHLLLLVLWGVAAAVVVVASWFATLFAGRSPDALHRFLARFLGYSNQVTAYMFLLANPYPPFGGGRPYPVELEVDPPERQNRWTVAFRLVLAVPALILANVLGYLLQILALLGWFACLAIGRMPEGMESLGIYCQRYSLQTYAYVFLLTQRYPSLSAATPATAPRSG